MKKDKHREEPNSAVETEKSTGSTPDLKGESEGEAAAVVNEEQQLVDEVEELRKQSEENYNKFARMSADFDNFRKRVAKEREEIFQVALEGLMKDLLPVVDNFERASVSFSAEGLEAKYLDGLEMILKQLMGALSKNGLSEIDTTMNFDPNFHHAIMQEPGDEDDQITMVLQKGYSLGSRVIRPAMVKVSVKE